MHREKQAGAIQTERNRPGQTAYGLVVQAGEVKAWQNYKHDGLTESG